LIIRKYSSVGTKHSKLSKQLWQGKLPTGSFPAHPNGCHEPMMEFSVADGGEATASGCKPLHCPINKKGFAGFASFVIKRNIQC
jgi:hypothetical protein